MFCPEQCPARMQSKLGVAGHEQKGLVRDIVQEYVRGLCWVMRYYYDGDLPLPPAPEPVQPSSHQQ